MSHNAVGLNTFPRDDDGDGIVCACIFDLFFLSVFASINYENKFIVPVSLWGTYYLR